MPITLFEKKWYNKTKSSEKRSQEALQGVADPAGGRNCQVDKEVAERCFSQGNLWYMEAAVCVG